MAAAATTPTHAASPSGSVVRQAGRVVLGAFDLAGAVLESSKTWVVFLIVLGIIAITGIVLVGARTLFFMMIPSLIEFAGPIVLGINGAIAALDTFSVVTSGFILALSFGSDSVDPLDIGFITIDEYKATLRAIVVDCDHFTSIQVIWERLVAPDISRSVCPYFRAVYPTTGGSLHAFQGIVTTDPDPYGNNCDLPPRSDYTVVCAGLGTGYVVLEFVLPALVILIVLLTTGRALLRLVWLLSELVIKTAYASVELVVDAGDRAERIILSPLTSYESSP